jgi:hypothetical protein
MARRASYALRGHQSSCLDSAIISARFSFNRTSFSRPVRYACRPAFVADFANGRLTRSNTVRSREPKWLRKERRELPKIPFACRSPHVLKHRNTGRVCPPEAMSQRNTIWQPFPNQMRHATSSVPTLNSPPITHAALTASSAARAWRRNVACVADEPPGGSIMNP